jgi:hypothetical protein
LRVAVTRPGTGHRERVREIDNDVNTEMGSSTRSEPPTAGVFVVGALHALHAEVPGFGYEELRKVIETIQADTMVLEVRPDELAERLDTQGRPEYPNVVWPLLNDSRGAVPMEPGGSLFTEMVDAVSQSFAAFTERDQASASFLSAYQRSLAAVLRSYWRHPADAHDPVTDELSRGLYLLQYTLVGDTFREFQDRWDQYMIDRALETIDAQRHRRILVLGSYRNRHRFDEAVRAAHADRVVQMDEWLRDRLPVVETASA